MVRILWLHCSLSGVIYTVCELTIDPRYSQNTTGSVPTQPISAACAVAASADDKSSHNVGCFLCILLAFPLFQNFDYE